MSTIELMLIILFSYIPFLFVGYSFWLHLVWLAFIVLVNAVYQTTKLFKEYHRCEFVVCGAGSRGVERHCKYCLKTK